MSARSTIALPLRMLVLLAGLLGCEIGNPAASGPPQTPQAPPATVQGAQANAPVALPNRDGALKFLVFGDFGTGSKDQYALATQMARLHDRFPFEMAILVG